MPATFERFLTADLALSRKRGKFEVGECQDSLEVGGDRAVQLRLFVFGATDTHLNRPSK